jgi:G protein beta subunit-like protein
MTNFEPLHKLQAHKEYILKCLLSPEFCEPQRQLPRFNIFISLFFFYFYFYFIKYVSYLHIALFMPNFLPAVRCKLISACITFSRYLATASADHTVKIWNVDGFTLEKTLTGIHQSSHNFLLCLLFYLHVKNRPSS